MIGTNHTPEVTEIDPWLIADIEAAYATVLDDDDAATPPPQLLVVLAAAVCDGGMPVGCPRDLTTERPRHRTSRSQRPWQRAPPSHPRMRLPLPS